LNTSGRHKFRRTSRSREEPPTHLGDVGGRDEGSRSDDSEKGRSTVASGFSTHPRRTGFLRHEGKPHTLRALAEGLG